MVHFSLCLMVHFKEYILTQSGGAHDDDSHLYLYCDTATISEWGALRGHKVEMLINVNIDLLRTFVTVVDVRNFTRAAEILFRTQSTISLQIKRLETIAQVELLLRDGRTVELTPPGVVVYEYARKILTLHDEMRVIIAKNDYVKEVIRIGMPDDYAQTLLVGVLQSFNGLSRKVEVAVTSDVSQVLRALVQDGTLDLAVVTSDDANDGSGLRLRDEKLKWVCGPDSAIARRDPLPLALFKEGCIFRKRALNALEVRQRRWEIAHSSNSYNAVRAALQSGSAISVLAESSIGSDLVILDHDPNLPDLGSVTINILFSKMRSAVGDLLAQTVQSVLSSALPTGLSPSIS